MTTIAAASTVHRRSRRLLQTVFAACIALGIAVLLYPLTPLVTYTIAPPRVQEAAFGDGVATTEGALPSFAAGRNVLVIPKIGVRVPVVEGETDEALDRGAWRIPGTSDDPSRGNMVVSAHRFRYRPPISTTFYLLDKLDAGDTLTLYWEGRAYRYRVARTFVAAPDAVEILQRTAAPTLTLFTCTPLFSTAQRLVVVSVPLDESPATIDRVAATVVR